MQAEIPQRFRPSRRVLVADRFMTHFIRLGGVLVISAVLAIFLFILAQVVPLFFAASVEEDLTVELPEGRQHLVAADEWSSLPLVLGGDGRLRAIDLEAGGAAQELPAEFLAGREITATHWRGGRQNLIIGFATGEIGLVHVAYRRPFADGKPKVTVALEQPRIHALAPEGRVVSLDYADSGAGRLAAAVLDAGGRRQVKVMPFRQTRGLMGAGKVEPGQVVELGGLIEGTPDRVLVPSTADAALVSTVEGRVYYFVRQGEEFRARQIFAPFEGEADPRLASMDFLLGDVSISLTSSCGKNRIYSLFAPEGSRERTFGRTKEMPPLPAGADFFSASLRNKSYLLGAGSTVSLRHSTTEKTRWQAALPYRVEDALLGAKHDSILLLEGGARLHRLRLHDPHPETSWKGLFGQVWYEGAPGPRYEWQSTGGSDDFEPKLSMIPLLLGTVKGTIYAMLFAVPIALLAALYTSQFLDPDHRSYVKPTMEIMASLPSVVLGFLAALWLAPLLEKQVPSLLLVTLAVPAAAAFLGWFWSGLPARVRRAVRPGWEYLAFAPVLLAVAYLAWQAGPVLERAAFVVTDAETGQKIADFRRWWPEVTGLRFEQRNSLVVGFMMGFAVIPIIFTIAEDALSNVPPTLSSASLALGASRWQTAWRVVLPTASPGIFSALMVGLGRAVGETMIVVMATGNTPITDMSIFTGMRTLSANIAVELPEAPHHGTLYRTLFLGAMLLFLLTFLVNTVAEVLRQHLREKFKTV